MSKRFEILLNPVAGAGASKRLVDRLQRRLDGKGHAVNVFCTSAAGDARKRAAELSADAADAILVAGGDGTISEVIDGLASTAGPLENGGHPPLAILPVGTENLLARVIGARANIAQAESTLLGGHVRQLDIGKLSRPEDRGDSWDSGDGPRGGCSHFLMVAGAGFDGEVIHRLARQRSGNITYANYIAPLLTTFINYRYPPLYVEADGEVICNEPALAFVGNIPRYALGIPILKNARFDDGLLDLVVFRCSDRRQLLAHSMRTLMRKHDQHPAVTYLHVKEAVIRADCPVPLEVDGDDGGQLPARFSMTGKQVALLTPPARSHGD